MPISFPPARSRVRPAGHVRPIAWRRPPVRTQCPADAHPALHAPEAMEKLATADDIAAAVRATGRA